MSWLEWDDDRLLALCLWREAQGEGEAGMRAVCHVIRNRMKTWKKTLRQAVLGKNQFTSMSVPTDPMYKKMPADNDVMWKVAQKLVTEDGIDPTHGALYYGNLKHIDKGGWFERNIVEKPSVHPVLARIGKHTFYR